MRRSRSAADPRADDEGADAAAGDPSVADAAGGAERPWFLPEWRQFVAGLLFGLACTARLPVLLAAPFFLLVGAGGSAWRRGWSAGIGAAIPVGLLLAYNLVSSGQLVHPAYDYLYQLETAGYPTLGYHPDWAIEDPRYLPQNLGIMLLRPPDVLPDRLPDALGYYDTPVCTQPGATRGLFDPALPAGGAVRRRDEHRCSTSPAYLLALAVARAGSGGAGS